MHLVPVTCETSNNFKITKSALESAYEKAREANTKIKGLIITNPSNPLGTVLDTDTLKTIVTFTNEKNIHLVCDEIYSATVFGCHNHLISISEVIEEMECNRDLIHIVYSLSKDLGLPGFRVGILYSYNDTVVTCSRRMSSFGLVSSQTQHLLALMLSDDAFIEKLLSESSKRLKKRYEDFTNGLKEVGIGCLESDAGLFCWMDLHSLLKEPTFEEETVIWRLIIDEVKLNISPGSSFHCSEPGWFRVCFANMDDTTLDVALQRIQEFVARQKEGEEAKNV